MIVLSLFFSKKSKCQLIVLFDKLKDIEKLLHALGE
jgi:hypothetical protein